MRLSAALLLGLSAVASPAWAASPPRAFPTGVDWRLVALDGKRIEKPVQASLRIDEPDLRAYGSSGCNRFTTTASHVQGRLIFTPIASTRRMCPPPFMDVEAKMLAILQANPVWAFRRGALVLTSEKGALRFRR